MVKKYDVSILGGGLAGLTLALQLKQNQPEISIVILEMRKKNAPVSAHKVGESTVELGTYYLREVLGLSDYLDEHQLPKQGLRFYFSPQVKDQIHNRVELGPKDTLPVPSHQIDRGVFENDLISRLKDLGVEFILGARTNDVHFHDTYNEVGFIFNGLKKVIKCNWLVDATGRACFLKRQLGFEKKLDHCVNAIWFRLKGEIDVDDWSDNIQWKNKLKPGLRRLGTIHFMGKGFWVWIIPLASGNTSVGIVSDPSIHQFSEINSFDKAMNWLAINEPLCALNFKKYKKSLLDFRVLKQLAFDSGSFYSTDKWGVVGEAAAFLDPFYSPGTDFIALGNTWMSDLILRDFQGEDVASRTIIYERVHSAFFESWVPIYQNKYALFGNTQVMVVKILWDWAVYWGVPTILFTNNGFVNIEVLRALFTSRNSLGSKLALLNNQVQLFFLDWAEKDNGDYVNSFVDFFDIPFLKKMHIELDAKLSDEDLINTCKSNLIILEQMATAIFSKVCERIYETPANISVNPYTMKLSASKESIFEQSQEKNSINASVSLVEDMELMWLKHS